MRFQNGQLQVLVTGPFCMYLEVGNDLVLRMQLNLLAELVGLARFPIAYDFGVRFKHADEFVRKLRQASEHSSTLVCRAERKYQDRKKRQNISTMVPVSLQSIQLYKIVTMR